MAKLTTIAIEKLRLRIPDEAAHDSGMMPPAVPI